MKLALCSVVTIVLALSSGTGQCNPSSPMSAKPSPSAQEVVCALAPSQSRVAQSVSAATGGAGVTAYALAQALGLSVVAHSSGAYILTGSGGYIAGTLGGAAISGPVIIGVGLVVGGTAMTLELVCAPHNHPEETSQVKAAAEEFLRRSGAAAKVTQDTIDAAKINGQKLANSATISLKNWFRDVFKRANQPASS